MDGYVCVGCGGGESREGGGAHRHVQNSAGGGEFSFETMLGYGEFRDNVGVWGVGTVLGCSQGCSQAKKNTKQHPAARQESLTGLFMNLRVISRASGGRVAENTPTWREEGDKTSGVVVSVWARCFRRCVWGGGSSRRDSHRTDAVCSVGRMDTHSLCGVPRAHAHSVMQRSAVQTQEMKDPLVAAPHALTRGRALQQHGCVHTPQTPTWSLGGSSWKMS